MTATTTPADPNNPTLAELIAMLREASPINAMPGSDELNRAYLAAQAQQNSSILTQATGLLGQNQTNKLRMMELMGSSGDDMTDAATRWRSELEAQQGIQGTRLRQEYAQLLGYDPSAGGVATLSGRQQALAEQQAAQQAAQQSGEMLGVYNGNATLANLQWQDNIRQAQAARDLQVQLATQAQNSQMAQQTSQQGWQSGESAAERAARLALQNSQQQFQGGESAAERALRLSLQQGQQTWQSGESAAERAARLELQQGQQTWQSGESQQERDLRERLQGGQLNQQESEFARTYLLQQDESRRQQSELSGYLGDGSGQLTEAARAARAGEQTQKAALAAQLMQSPRDVFRAGAYFRSLRGANPAAMGLTGGGIAGFNGRGDRAALGLPGTITPDDMLAAVGGSSPSNATAAPNAATARLQGAGAGTDGPPSVDSTGGAAATPPATGGQGATPPIAATEDDGTAGAAGTEAGGPVGPTIDGLLGDLGMSGPPGPGMGAGGSFPGRAPAATAPASGGRIPYIDPRVFDEPEVAAMTRGLRARGQVGARASSGRARGPSGPVERAERRAGTTPSRVEVGPYRFGEKTARARQNSDERFLRGAALSGAQMLNQRLGPGTGPAGPVDAPLWPSGADAGTSAPQLQSATSLGSTPSSFQASAAAAPTLGQLIPSLDPATQDYALGQTAQMLMGGVGNLGAQALERQSKTQRGAFEGSLEAAGLDPDDFMQAYAQSRFNNTGNTASA